MITPSFGLTATERVLPKLALDFTTASLDSRITFTRTTNATNPATYINSSGVITAATNNQPRFDYTLNTGGTCKGLLIEESRANLCIQSEDFSSVSWNGQNGGTGSLPVVTSNAAVAPDGNTTADKIVFNTGAGTSSADLSLLRGASITTTAISYATTIYLKGEVGGEKIMIQGPSNSGYTLLTLTTSWQRFTLVETGFASTGYKINFGVRQGIGGIGTINANPTIYAWGAQLEAGAFATSYIPTTLLPLTRNADVATMTGANFSDWWQAVTGSAAVYYTPLTVSGTRPVIQFDDNTSTNLICLRGNTTNPELYIKATTDQVQIDAGTIASNISYTLVGSWSTNDCAAAISGNAAVTDLTATIPTVSQSRLGCDGTNYLNGILKTIRYWPQRITNAETQAFSK